ncbi:MAG: M28 family peptidase [Candidatus Hydrogenedentes bacterium]|nr:M28 family peptidase [Candidatus Hydrogenedentota bacterium]
MGMAEMRRDIEYLAGNLTHRGASTESERAAAEYIRDRFTVHTANTEIDDFFAIESPWLLFSSYYAEYLIVALLAFWQPWFAFGYGAIVSILYLLEFSGYRVLALILPQYETQNVVARILGDRPKKLFVITAHYDTPKFSAVTSPQFQPWLRTLHIIVLACMFAVLASCAAEALGIVGMEGYRYDLVLRWCAVTALLCFAVALFTCEYSGEFTRGASDNASGVAVLLDLAQRFTHDRIDGADVWLVATGSKETWLSGMRRFLNTHTIDKTNTYFLNIDQVGSGELRYITAEGLLQSLNADPELLGIAAREAVRHQASALTWRGLPSDAFLAMARGFRALSITAIDEKTYDDSDRAGGIDYSTVTAAASYAEGIIRSAEKI